MAKDVNKRSHAQREEEELEKVYQGMYSDSGKSSKKSESSKRRIAIIAICVTVVVLAIAILIGCIYVMKVNETGLILGNITVAGVDVGGMTKAQAIDAVQAATENTYSKNAMVVTVLDSTVTIPAKYVGTLNVKAAVQDAFNYGRWGFNTKRQQQTAATVGYAVDITPHLDLDTKGIRAALSKLGEKYSSTLTQSTYEIIGEKPTADQINAGTDLQKLVVTLGIPEYGLDMDALYEQVLDTYNQNVFEVNFECDTVEPDPIDLEGILAEHYIAPTDAGLHPDTYEIVAGVYGYGFDVEDARKRLEVADFGTEVEIPFIRIEPEITTEELSSLLYRDTLATYTAKSSSQTNRNTNLRLACEAINGLVLNPGEVFSYNDALGERTTQKGYKPAASYSGNETVNTPGGGICQVSSSLYYCALLSDLEILVRENHRFVSSYMPLGMDATVSWGAVDFRFRNNTNYPIRIEASASGGSTTVTILGTDEKDYYVEMEHEVVKVYPSSTTYKEMSANNPDGYKNGEYIVTPYKGYDVKTYRCKYDKETKELISRSFEDDSDYKKRDAVICEIKEATSSGGSTGTTNPGLEGSGGVSEGGGSLPED